MTVSSRLVGILAVAALVSPAQANVRDAAFASTSNGMQARTSVFAGATYTVGLGSHAKRSSRAALNVSGMHSTPAAAQVRIGRGVEIARGKTGKAALHIAGADLGQLNRTANANGGGRTALIVVGAIAVTAVVALVVIDSLKCEDEGKTCD